MTDRVAHCTLHEDVGWNSVIFVSDSEYADICINLIYFERSMLLQALFVFSFWFFSVLEITLANVTLQ